MTDGELKILVRSYLERQLSKDELRARIDVEPSGDKPAASLNRRRPATLEVVLGGVFFLTEFDTSVWSLLG